MHGTDEVWVAGKEEAAIAFGEFGHGRRVRFWFKFLRTEVEHLFWATIASFECRVSNRYCRFRRARF